MKMVVMSVRDIDVVNSRVLKRLEASQRVRPPLSSETRPVPPWVRQDPHTVCLDEDTCVPNKCDPHAGSCPSCARRQGLRSLYHDCFAGPSTSGLMSLLLHEFIELLGQFRCQTFAAKLFQNRGISGQRIEAAARPSPICCGNG